ncbi:MAG: hypothetical protein JW797_19095 [Bradymonadales bacterium]|nr:hypothetical protein [Bradymonadales bacterium]
MRHSIDTSGTLPPSLLQALSGVRSVGIITGAGVSAESGLPTYRGTGGVYEDPDEGDRTIEAVSAPMLYQDPDRTWRAVASLARQAHGAKPNAAHQAIVRMERSVDRFVLLTQNVDGLHQLAGSRNIIDIHGNAFNTICMRCGARGRVEDLEGIVAAPHCFRCDGILRPDVVLFGEMLPDDKVLRMQESFYQHSPDLVLAAGTTALFPYIMEPVMVAQSRGCLTIEVNTEVTILTSFVDYSLRGAASHYLPLIADALVSSRAS